MLNELSKQIHKNNVEKGFYDDDNSIGLKIALIHSEVSEALEAMRKLKYAPQGAASFSLEVDDDGFVQFFKENVKDTFEDELADSVIRILDLCGYLGIPIQDHVEAKLRYNKTRPYKHGKQF